MTARSPIDLAAWKAARPACRRAVGLRFLPGVHGLYAARAVRGVRSASSLPAVRLAELVARGTTVHDDARWIAVEDDHSVTLTTTAGPGDGPQLPLSVVVNLGNTGGW